ncbi:ectonucleotide pyrophosphatase/phosphodiesterase family member 5-like [Littorina saxatilis]|uniref:Ectonucleotide pyrophosphatase/phosphodiesterase family member 5 n=1 Tax=Littorina saxatilis TaxID=31220 RepID=A0AAN9GK14_9CAEN
MLSLSLLLMVVVAGAEEYSGKVLLISMDGFRWDYLNKISGLGNFTRLRENSCSVDFVNNVFSTKTFPCHYSIATGLYEETHGIVSNHMYDPDHNATFSKGAGDPFWWDGGEPIWVTAERQNKTTGVFYWPGSETRIRGYLPSIYRVYDESIPFPYRVETALNWFVDNGTEFVALYFHEPDHTGHAHGPDSMSMDDKVREMDGILGLILATLEEKKLSDVNVILTSDHGMAEIDVDNRLLDLWEYLDESMVEMVPDSGTVTPILPKAGQTAKVFEAASKIPHVKAYLKDDIPAHFHYQNNPRIMPIVLISEEGWMLVKNYTDSKVSEGRGNHGYSNELPSMKPIFFAWGPDFRKGVHSKSISSLDIYPLMCRLLNIEAAPNNGSLDSTAHFLLHTPHASSAPALFAQWLCVNVVLLLCVCMVV